MAFNPDEYLKEKQGQFNPDEYLAQRDIETNTPALQSFAEGLANAAVVSKPVLAGGSQTLMNILTGITSPSDAVEEYRRIRDAEKASQQALTQANPNAALAGSLVGSAVPGGLIGKAIGPATEGANLVQRALQASKVGAAGGALEGFGNTQADITKGEFSPAIKDILANTAFGAGTGLGTEAGISAVRTGKNAAKAAGESVLSAFPFLDKLGKVIKTEAKGTKLAGKEAFEQSYNDLYNKVDELALGAKETAESFPKEIKKVIDTAQKAGIKIDIAEKLEPLKSKLMALRENIDNPEVLSDIDKSLEFLTRKLEHKQKSVGKLLEDIRNPKEFSPEQVVLAKREAGSLVGPSSQESLFKTGIGRQEGGEVLGALKESESAIPGLNEINKKSSNAMKALELLGLDSRDFIKNPETGVIELEASAKQKIANKIRQSETEQTTHKGAQDFLNQALVRLKTANPELADKLGPALKDVSERVDLTRAVKGEGLLNKGMMGSTGLTTGALVGRAAGSVAKGISSITPDRIKQITSELSTQGNKGLRIAQQLAEVANKDDVARNATIFSLMQNPEYREMLKGYFKQEE